jgi:hypothetical protein
MTIHYPHRIRLRGPWEYDATGGAAGRGRLSLPAALSGTALAEHSGPVRFSRRFGYPGRIDAGERVWLLVEGLASAAAISLNGTDLGSAAEAGFDVTSLLEPRNELTVELAVTAGQGAPWNEVCLEVRRTAYLRDVRVLVLEGNVEAAGLVVGHAETPLDLYLLANGSSLAYISLTPRESGQPFHLCGSAGAAGVAEVKVELVQGGVVWYADRHLFTQEAGC